VTISRIFLPAFATCLLCAAIPAEANAGPEPVLSHSSLDDLENHFGILGLLGLIGLLGLRRRPDRR